MVNYALGLIGGTAGAAEILLGEGREDDAGIGGPLHAPQGQPQQLGGGERLALVQLAIDVRRVGSRAHEVGADAQGAGGRIGIAEAAGVGEDGGVQAHRDIGVGRHSHRDQQAVHHLAGGGGPGIHPLQVAEGFLGGVVVNVNDGAGALQAGCDRAAAGAPA